MTFAPVRLTYRYGTADRCERVELEASRPDGTINVRSYDRAEWEAIEKYWRWVLGVEPRKCRIGES